MNLIEVRNFDYEINEEDYNKGVKLVIIRERITMDEIEHAGAINEEKTFKEDKCMICLDKEPNGLFCSCGHICVCEECRKNLENKNMCVSCRVISVNVRIIE